MKVIIIGAGVAGLSVGWRLARSGCEVVVLERARPGRGATWAAGGMIAAAAEAGRGARPETAFAKRSAALWPQFALDIERESGRQIFYRRDGSLIVAQSRQAMDELSAKAGEGASFIARDEALRLEPMLNSDIAGALWAPGDAQVDNRSLGLALALALVQAGGALNVNESVVRFEMEHGAVRGVRTPFHVHEGDAFVLAAGAWSGEIAGLPREVVPPVIPVKGEMIALRPQAANALPTRLVWGEGVYLIPRHELLFVGATVERCGFDTSATRAGRIWLLEGAARMMPRLRDWPLVEHWAGLRPGSPDDLPIVGETVLSGLFVASGQFRNGILFAPAIADALHSLIVEHLSPPDILGFDPKRFDRGALVGGGAVR